MVAFDASQPATVSTRRHGIVQSPTKPQIGPVAQLDRASDFGSEGWGFDSLRGRQFHTTHGPSLRSGFRLRAPASITPANRLKFDTLAILLNAVTFPAVPSDHTPRRIVSLQPSATVILAQLGVADRLVACTKYCVDVCPEVSGRTLVADSWTASCAEIVVARPDLVIAAVPYQEKALAEILKAGARFLGLAPRTLSDIYTDIATIAGMLNVSRRGEEIIREMQGNIDAVRRRVPSGARPRVFSEEWGKPLIASQPWVKEMVETAGGEFIGRPGVPTSAEEVAASDPDIIVAAWCGAGDRVPLEKMVQARAWQKLGAVANARVYCIRDEYLNTPAPTLLRGLNALAAAIHPETFPQSDDLRCIRNQPVATPAL
jgi:iron complex transport system substrate-binding protein